MKTLIAKYLSNTITSEELQDLMLWLKDPANQSEMEDYIKDYHDINLSTLNLDKKEALKKIKTQIQGNNKTIKVIPFYKKPMFKVGIAASVVLFLALGFLFKTTFTNSLHGITEEQNKIVNNTISTGQDKATLTLEDGTEVILEKGVTFTNAVSESNGEVLTYKPSEMNSKSEMKYHYLTIPRGGEFFITLMDGTKVWLNSETQLKYPVQFVKGEDRNVELVYGEAYFEVSPSYLHDGVAFKVLNNAQTIEVLGTKFNVKAYNDEADVYTTLLEGKVAIQAAHSNQVLMPNQQATVNKTTAHIDIKGVDVKNEIAWLNGEFVIEHKTLQDIMRELSRWYDMDVVFENEKLKDVRFVGVLGKDQSIVEILNTIESFGVIKGYEINNKRVTLK